MSLTLNKASRQIDHPRVKINYRGTKDIAEGVVVEVEVEEDQGRGVVADDSEDAEVTSYAGC